MGVGLGNITETTTVYGFFPIIFEDNVYTVLSVCAIMELLPTRTTKVNIEGETYYEFHFDADSKIIKSLNLVKKDTLTFNVMNEFIMKGKAPWWTTLDDLCCIFDTANKHAGSAIAKVPQTIEFLAGLITRKRDARKRPIRQMAKKPEDFELKNIEFVALLSVQESVSNTLNKMSGSYFNDGIISAINDPTEKASRVEKILRK